MFRCLQARLTRHTIRERSALLLQPPAQPANYRLVGYATTPEVRRLRIYVEAEAPVTPQTVVLAQVVPGRFDYYGQPLGLRKAPEELSQFVRAHLLGRSADANLRGATFQAA